MNQAREDLLGRALAALLCLPAFVLVMPFGPLRGDALVTEISGTAWTALLLLPAAVLAIFCKRGRTTGLFLLLAYWLWTAAGATRTATDSLESDRAMILVTIAGVSTIAGAGLNDAGKRALATLLMVLSLVTSLATLHLRHADGDWAGPLGNSGETALVFVPGAIIGSFYAARRVGWWRIVGASTALLALGVATAAPSLTAIVAIFLGTLAATLARGTGRALQASVCGVAIACVIFAAFLRPVDVPGAPSMAEQSVGSASGLAVRFEVIPSSLALVAANPLFGIGAGQFVARYPEVRDPDEIELSTHGRKLDSESEVEHPHNDLVLAFVESGVIGGLAFALFLIVAAARALKILVRSDPQVDAVADGRVELACTVVGVLALGLLWYPLTYLAVAAAPAFAAIGALLSDPDRIALTRTRRALPLAAAVLLAMFLPRAVAMAEHGRALAQLGTDSSAEDWDRQLGLAQEACRDSVTALSLRASYLRQTGAPDTEQRRVWMQAHALRPQRFEVLMSLGNVELRLDNTHAAREWFARARAIDPYHPILLRNIARLEFTLDDLPAADAALDDLAAKDRLDKLWLLGLGTDLVLSGRLRAGQAAFARIDPRFVDLSGEACKALELEYRQQGHLRVGEAFETLAYTIWANEQAAAGAWDDCRRSLRQALRSPRLLFPPEGPIRLRMQLAAALYRSEQVHEAREIMESIEPSARDWIEVPDWVGETLLEQGWMTTAPR